MLDSHVASAHTIAHHLIAPLALPHSAKGATYLIKLPNKNSYSLLLTPIYLYQINVAYLDKAPNYRNKLKADWPRLFA